MCLWSDTRYSITGSIHQVWPVRTWRGSSPIQRRRLLVFAGHLGPKLAAARTLKCIMETSADISEGGRPAGSLFYLALSTCSQCYISIWGRKGGVRWEPEDTPSRTHVEYFSTCLESRTAFNLIWVYLHKSPLNLNVRDLNALSRKDRTHGWARLLPKEISIRLEIERGESGRSARTGKIRRLGKRVGRNRNEIFRYGMKSRVRLMVSSFVYISRIPGIIGKSKFSLRSLQWRRRDVSPKPIAIDSSLKRM